MENNKYLTEERYQRVNKNFKIFYFLLSIIGIGMVIGGVILLIKSNSVDYFSVEKMIAVALVILGIALTILSLCDLFRHVFARDIEAYYVQQQMPIVQEGVEKMATSVGVVAKEISTGVKEEKGN